jgi:hypothetical protein
MGSRGISAVAGVLALLLLGAACGRSGPPRRLVGVSAASIKAPKTVPITPDVGIATVGLGERHANVTRHLGNGDRLADQTWRYRTSSGPILVAFDQTRRVDSVESSAPGLELYGDRLTRGARFFVRPLRRLGWRGWDCGPVHVAVSPRRHGGETAVEWSGTSVYAQVDRFRTASGCGAP